MGKDDILWDFSWEMTGKALTLKEERVRLKVLQLVGIHSLSTMSECHSATESTPLSPLHPYLLMHTSPKLRDYFKMLASRDESSIFTWVRHFFSHHVPLR